MTVLQRILLAISPSHGRALIYVWAVEQDDLSKRSIPQGQEAHLAGQDVFVPWVLAKGQVQQKATDKATHGRKSRGLESEEAAPKEEENPPPVFNRYYHMFAKGELTKLVHDAAGELGLAIGAKADSAAGCGIEIVQDGWERSNYYVELQRWEYR